MSSPHHCSEWDIGLLGGYFLSFLFCCVSIDLSCPPILFILFYKWISNSSMWVTIDLGVAWLQPGYAGHDFNCFVIFWMFLWNQIPLAFRAYRQVCRSVFHLVVSDVEFLGVWLSDVGKGWVGSDPSMKCFRENKCSGHLSPPPRNQGFRGKNSVWKKNRGAAVGSCVSLQAFTLCVDSCLCLQCLTTHHQDSNSDHNFVILYSLISLEIVNEKVQRPSPCQ